MIVVVRKVKKLVVKLNNKQIVCYFSITVWFDSYMISDIIFKGHAIMNEWVWVWGLLHT